MEFASVKFLGPYVSTKFPMVVICMCFVRGAERLGRVVYQSKCILHMLPDVQFNICITLFITMTFFLDKKLKKAEDSYKNIVK